MLPYPRPNTEKKPNQAELMMKAPHNLNPDDPEVLVREELAVQENRRQWLALQRAMRRYPQLTRRRTDDLPVNLPEGMSLDAIALARELAAQYALGRRRLKR